MLLCGTPQTVGSAQEAKLVILIEWQYSEKVITERVQSFSYYRIFRQSFQMNCM